MPSNANLMATALKGIATYLKPYSGHHVESPKVENLGLYWNSYSNGFGVDTGITFDVSGGYSTPFYAQNQYGVMEMSGYANIGGR